MNVKNENMYTFSFSITLWNPSSGELTGAFFLITFKSHIDFDNFSDSLLSCKNRELNLVEFLWFFIESCVFLKSTKVN